MPQPAEARRPPAGVPVSSIDPFSPAFLADPHPGHAALREAGPVVWLEAYGGLRGGALRRGARNSRRPGDLLFEPGRGLERLRPGKAVAAAEPGARARSARARPGAGGAEPRAVGDGDALAQGAVRRSGGKACGRPCAKGPVRRSRRLRRSLSDDGHARRGRTVERGPRASAALCGDRVQHVRPRQRAQAQRDRADGAACRVDFCAMQAGNLSATASAR